MQNSKIVRRIAIKEARELLKSNFCVLDTETTGLGNDAEIVEIAITDAAGNELLSTLVRPIKPIPADVGAIHGIDNDMVQNAPLWSGLHEEIMTMLAQYRIGIYNAPYDLRMIHQTAWQSECWLPRFERQSKCVMDIYSKFAGVWSDHHGSWKWHKLGVAAAACGIAPTGAHRALADCRMTLGILRHVAAQEL